MTKNLSHTEKLEAIEKWIREAVPRLQELSFGCTLNIKPSIDENWCIADYLGVDYRDYPRDRLCRIRNNGHITRVPRVFEIIGHPIDLEAVLEALNNKSRPWKLSVGVWQDGKLMLGGDGEDIYWQYGKDLSQQSEELIDFLFNLLITE